MEVSSISEYKSKLWDRASQVRTLRDFRDLLSELSSTTFGTIFYSPLAFKFNELYNQVRWRYTFFFISALALGFIFGYVIRSLY